MNTVIKIMGDDTYHPPYFFVQDADQKLPGALYRACQNNVPFEIRPTPVCGFYAETSQDPSASKVTPWGGLQTPPVFDGTQTVQAADPPRSLLTLRSVAQFCIKATHRRWPPIVLSKQNLFLTTSIMPRHAFVFSCGKEGKIQAIR